MKRKTILYQAWGWDLDVPHTDLLLAMYGQPPSTEEERTEAREEAIEQLVEYYERSLSC